MHLYPGDVMLDKKRQIQDYLLTNESKLYAVPPGEIPLVIRYTYQKVTLVCSQKEIIEDTKMKIEHKESVPVEHNDKMTLKEANVRPGTQLQLEFGGPDCFSQTQLEQMRFLDVYLREECRHVVSIQQELESRDKKY